MGVLSAITGGAKAASAIATPIVGAVSAAKDRKWQEKMMEKQMSYNTEMYERQLSDTWDFYNDQKEYNSATAQRSRLEAAGLNPYLMMNGGSAGVAQSQSVPSANGVGLPSGYPRPGINGLTDSLGEIGNLIADLDIKSESAKQLKIENAYRGQKLYTELLEMRNRMKNDDSRVGIDAMLASVRKGLLQAQTGKTNTENMILGINAQAAALDVIRKQEELKTLPAQLQADLSYRLGEIALQVKEGKIKDKQLDKMLYEIEGTILDNNQKSMNQAEQSDTYKIRRGQLLATLRKCITDINVVGVDGAGPLAPLMMLLNNLGKASNGLDGDVFEQPINIR